MKHGVLKKQHISNMCFVCGVRNDIGLHAEFYETDDNDPGVNDDWFFADNPDDPSEIEIT